MVMTTIQPPNYITDTDPTDATAKTVSSWYKDESASGVSEENIAWMIAQGWRQDGDATKDGEGNKTFKMKRRQVDSEKLLQDLVSDYTTAYNEGRTLNDSRYDEIVTLYSVMQRNSQIDWQSREAGDTTTERLILILTNALDSDYDSYESTARALMNGYGTSLLVAINTRFDNLLTSAAQDLTNRGMYNSTVWTAVAAGIETQRSIALADANDQIALRQTGLRTQLHHDKSTMRSKVISASERVWTLISASADTRLNSRNAVMTALLSFMERRTDSYPSLDQIGRLATALGAGNAAGFQP